LEKTQPTQNGKAFLFQIIVEVIETFRPERSEAQSKDIFASTLRLRCTPALAGGAREKRISAQREVIFRKSLNQFNK
jgi:hypothetical protein